MNALVGDTAADQRAAFAADVRAGLARPQKTVPSGWLYDDRGSALFEEITGLPEYYPTRTERSILKTNANALADFFGERATLIEYGAGASLKTEIVLAALQTPRLYVPIDIAGDFLDAAAARLRTRFADLAIQPVVADFTNEFDLPETLPAAGPRGAFFPGSTLGNLAPADAIALLKRMHRHTATPDMAGRAVIGIDLRKSLDRLLPAYNDAAGVTAAFNKNLLHRINRELDGNFDVDAFDHDARWNEEASAVEMHLVSRTAQSVQIGGATFAFNAGETIHTESSRKYTRAGFEEIAQDAGWVVSQVWTDADELFALVGLTAR